MAEIGHVSQKIEDPDWQRQVYLSAYPCRGTVRVRANIPLGAKQNSCTNQARPLVLARPVDMADLGHVPQKTEDTDWHVGLVFDLSRKPKMRTGTSG